MTTYAEEARFGHNETVAAVLPMSYVRSVHASGGRAVLITPDAPDVDALDGLDAIIFTGGSDLGPALYGEPPHPATYVRPERDAAELLLVHAAVAADLPVLGICRGMQLLTVAYGGRLHQHLPDLLGHDNHRPATGPKYGTHPVRLAAGSACHRILGDTVMVNSLHHQGVQDPGRLTPTGWCPEDELIETVEDPERTFVVGVQWHPEETSDLRMFAALTAAAAARRAVAADRPTDGVPSMPL
nr:gamma-glutamyl-gamma-aminobutyrate hydrolase family protein [Planosporangium thailandense]